MYITLWVSWMVLVVKNPLAITGDKRDVGLIPGSGRSPEGGHGTLLQYHIMICNWMRRLQSVQSAHLIPLSCMYMTRDLGLGLKTTGLQAFRWCLCCWFRSNHWAARGERLISQGLQLAGGNICAHAAAAGSLQSSPTLCGPTDGSPPGSAVPGIRQAGTLEWGAISFSSAWKWKVKVNVTHSCPTLCDPTDYTAHGILQARILHWVAFPFSRGSSQQGSNPGLLHCRQILYQLNQQGSPRILEW